MSDWVCTVVGGGRMGSGIAHALLLAGARVLVSDEGDPEVVQRRIAGMVAASAERGKVDDAAAVLERLSVGRGASPDAASDLVVESVPEDPALKSRVLAFIEAAVTPECVIATNTSSISVNELAAVLERPSRFLGLHFFNPVPASSLVEIVLGEVTDEATLAAASRAVEAMGKTAITVADAPGFASSRLGVLLGLEAIRMVEEGVASAEDIDAAMTLGYRHPMGPLRLTDMVGLDVRLGIAEYLAEHLGPRFEPPALMRAMVARGELGQKSGQGFYSWPSGV